MTVSLLIEVKRSGQAPLINNILTTGGYSVDNIIIWAREPFSYDEFHGVIPGVRQVTGILPLASITDAFLADRQAKGDYGIGMVSIGLTQADVDKIHSYGFLTYSLPSATGGIPLVTQIALGINGYHTPDELWWNNYIAVRPCLDRIDNDGDGFGDFDGIDLDLDGVHETPPDAACDDRLTLTETTECQDLVDNDGDMLVDLADPECLSVNTTSETVPPPSSDDRANAFGSEHPVVGSFDSRPRHHSQPLQAETNRVLAPDSAIPSAPLLRVRQSRLEHRYRAYVPHFLFALRLVQDAAGRSRAKGRSRYRCHTRNEWSQDNRAAAICVSMEILLVDRPISIPC